MRIGLVAPPWVPVPPTAYGGTEAVVDCLARGLAARGHDVTLFTVGTSTCPVTTAWLFPEPVAPIGLGVAEADHVLAAYRELSGFDIIHDHTGLGPVFAAGAADPRTVVLTTNHGPFTPQNVRLFSARPAGVGIVCISHHQRSTADGLRIEDVIHHGIDLDLYRPTEDAPGDHLVFVGRMDPGKGPDRAINIARATGRPIVIIAKCREEIEQEYFDTVIKPMLGSDVTVAGEMTAEERIGVVQRAAATVVPIRWPEPFGLVMVESLACGTPVLAFPHGAAPEIVDHGVTGFLGADEAALVEAVGRLPEIDRAACREAAVQRFSLERMAIDHERLYERMLRSVRAPMTPMNGLWHAQLLGGAGTFG